MAKTVSIGGKNYKAGSKRANEAVSAGGKVSTNSAQIRANSDASKAATKARTDSDPLSVIENNGGTVPSYISPNTINSSLIKPATPMTIPTPPTPSTLGTQAMTGLAGYASTVGTTTPGGASTETKTPQSADFKSYLKGITQAPDSEKIYQKTLKESGLQDKQNTVNSLTGQLNAITAKAQADKLSLVGQGRGVPEVIIGGQQAKIDREAAIQSLPISAQLSAAQGDLESARSFMETMFKIRLDDAQSKVDYKNKVNDAVYQYASDEQKTALDERRRMDDRAFDIERDNISYLRDLANTAIENGQPSLAATLMGLDPSSKNFESLVGSYASQIRVPQKDTGGGAADLTAGQREILSGYLQDVYSYTSREEALADLGKKASAIRVEVGQDGLNLILDEIDTAFPGSGGGTTETSTTKRDPYSLLTGYKPPVIKEKTTLLQPSDINISIEQLEDALFAK